MLFEEDIPKFLRAGKIACKALKYGLDIAEEGMPILELCEKIENYIRSLGGELAFPCNISINDVAAHYTAKVDDDLVIPKKAVVKIDVGVHIEGCIADTAGTKIFDLSLEPLVISVERALSEALKKFRPGQRLDKIGAIIEKNIAEYGLKPISNLTGHMINKWTLHAGKIVPNIKCYYPEKIEKYEVYAIEPFSTNGEGKVIESSEAVIFRLTDKKPKDKELRKTYKKLKSAFKSLPFCDRWVLNVSRKIFDTYNRLKSTKSIFRYPVLIEAGRGLVAQAEHTVIVLDRDIIVTTAEDSTP